MDMTAEEQIEHLTAQLKQALEELRQTRDQLQARQEELRQAQGSSRPTPNLTVGCPSAAQGCVTRGTVPVSFISGSRFLSSTEGCTKAELQGATIKRQNARREK
jgi:hypothetical protein